MRKRGLDVARCLSVRLSDRRTDGRTDTGRQQRPRLRIASRGKNAAVQCTSRSWNSCIRRDATSFLASEQVRPQPGIRSIDETETAADSVLALCWPEHHHYGCWPVVRKILSMSSCKERSFRAHHVSSLSDCIWLVLCDCVRAEAFPSRWVPSPGLSLTCDIVSVCSVGRAEYICSITLLTRTGFRQRHTSCTI